MSLYRACKKHSGKQKRKLTNSWGKFFHINTFFSYRVPLISIVKGFPTIFIIQFTIILRCWGLSECLTKGWMLFHSKKHIVKEKSWEGDTVLLQLKTSGPADYYYFFLLWCVWDTFSGSNNINSMYQSWGVCKNSRIKQRYQWKCLWLPLQLQE